MVFIANYWTLTSPTDVRVYSNCDVVKLYINDVLQASQTPDTSYPTANLLHPPFTFEGLAWQAGQLRAEGYIADELAAVHTTATPGEPESLEINFDMDELNCSGDITFVYVSVVDADGTLVVHASNLVDLQISGSAILLSPSQVQAEAGIATFLIRSTSDTGLITVEATASGLDGDIKSISLVCPE